MQGFDEFMNLVIDDAVEVRLPTKTEEEKRRPLGMHYSPLPVWLSNYLADSFDSFDYRANLAKR